MIKRIHHVQFRVPAKDEQDSLYFYRVVLGLEQIPKPPNLQKNGGAWFKISDNSEVHILIRKY